VSVDEISIAIKSIKTSKSEDIFGMSIENMQFAGNELLNHVCTLINYIFSNRLSPDVIKTDLLSPVYKNKGDNHRSKNYRGIVVLPVLLKSLNTL
jgi:CheY-specific phosphatase CheX